MAVWNSSFEADPAGSGYPSQGDDSIRDFKVAVRERITKEHRIMSSLSLDGIHKQGSALAYMTTVAPVVLPDGSTSFGNDVYSKGRIWCDHSGKRVRYWNGLSWSGFDMETIRGSVQGTLVAGQDVIPPMQFARTMLISRICARIKTAPTGSPAAVTLCISKRATSGTASAPLHNAATTKLILSAGGMYCLRSAGQMSATKLSITPASWLALNIEAVGGTVKGSDISVSIEAERKS